VHYDIPLHVLLKKVLLKKKKKAYVCPEYHFVSFCLRPWLFVIFYR